MLYYKCQQHLFYDIICPLFVGWGSGMSEKISLESFNQSQKERLEFIDFRINFLGSIRRSDMADRFGIKEAAATRDITLYRELCPNNVKYSTNKKKYYRSRNYSALFLTTTNEALRYLTHGFESRFKIKSGLINSFDMKHISKLPDIDLLATIMRAMHSKRVVKIKYLSTSDNIKTKTSREIIPYAIANSGLRWHVRAFDRKRNAFIDLVLARISSARRVKTKILEHEKFDEDIQWHRIVEMDLVPHPHMKAKDAIYLDYNFNEEGVFCIKMRAALAGYFLRFWNVDCTENHTLRTKNDDFGKEYQLWLKSPTAALYKVESAFLAPGFILNKKSA